MKHYVIRSFETLLVAFLLTLTAQPLPAQENGTAAQSLEENASQAEAPNAADVSLSRQDVDETVDRFTMRVMEFHSEISEQVENEYKRLQKAIENRYDKDVKKLEGEERLDIELAIAKFEKFIARYPSEKLYTPDVMFRLAELYYIVDKEKFDRNSQALWAVYEKELQRFDEGQISTEPVQPHADFSRSIELYNRIATVFPDYRYIDAVYYLLAYAYKQHNNLPKVRESFENLIALRPDSKYIAEAYLYIGNAYFDEMMYEPALAAYQKAANFKDSRFYDGILYKLASTYYITNRFGEAVRAFADVCDFSEEKYKKEGRHSYFRQESLDYIAFCYSQGAEYWSEVGVNGLSNFFARIGSRPYESYIYTKLGDNFLQQTIYPEAIQAYRIAIQKDPWNRENPFIQKKIIDIYIVLKDNERGNEERTALINNYGEGSEWAMQNADDPEAVKAAWDMALDSLKQWAYYQHAQAQRYSELENYEGAKKFYMAAAGAYQDFLNKFPHDKEAYVLTYRMADANYWAGEYAKAAPIFLSVRDDKSNKEYFDQAAEALVLCYWEMIEAEGGRLTQTEERHQQLQEARLKGETAEKEIPQLKQQYIDAGDFYVKNSKSPRNREGIAYNIAEILFEYNHLEAARERYIDMIQRFPSGKNAIAAAKRIVDTYTVVEDWVKVAEWSEKIANMQLGEGQARGEMVAEMKRIRGSAIASYAFELQKRKEYYKAAEQFLKAVEQDRTHKDAPAMLYNAAANYSAANRPAKAMELFERMVAEYPQAEFAAESLYYVAENAYRSFNFDKSSQAFARLYREYPDIEPKRKCQAIYAHAQVMEFNHDYRNSAGIYEKYSSECATVEDDSAITLFKAGAIYEKLEDWRNMTRLYEDFITRYGKDPENFRFVVMAYSKMGDAFAKRRDMRSANNYYQKAIDFFQSKPSIAKDFIGNELAAKAKFELLEQEYEKYKLVKVTGSGKKLQQTYEAKTAAMTEIVRIYNEVRAYASPEYWVASKFRQGEAIESFADQLFDAPVPREVTNLGEDAVIMYQQQLFDFSQPLYKAAAQTFMEALEIAKSQKLFGSPWTQKVFKALAHPNLSQFLTGEFKMRKKEKYLYQEDVRIPLPFDSGIEHVKETKTGDKAAEQPKTGENTAAGTAAETPAEQKALEDAEKAAAPQSGQEVQP